MKTDFQLLQNQVTSHEVRIGNLENNKVIGRNYFVMRNLSEGLWGGDSAIHPGNYQHTPMINIPVNQKNVTITFYTKQASYGGTGVLFDNVNGAALKYYNIDELTYVDVTNKGMDAVTIAKLPSGFEPTRDQRQVMQGSSNNTWLLTVTKAGEVQMARYSQNGTVDAGRWFSGTMTYMAG